MDKAIKKHFRTAITVYPCIGSEDGDKQFGEPVVYKGCYFPKNVLVTNRDGEEVQSKSVVYLDGKYADVIADTDEISAQYLTRHPIQSIVPYFKLNSDKVDILEIYL